MKELRRLSPDDRFKKALTYRGKYVRMVRIAPGSGNPSEFRGWVTSVANLQLGMSDAVLVLRTDQTRIDKDLAFSLAQIGDIIRLGFDGRPIKGAA